MCRSIILLACILEMAVFFLSAIGLTVTSLVRSSIRTHQAVHSGTCDQ